MIGEGGIPREEHQLSPKSLATFSHAFGDGITCIVYF